MLAILHLDDLEKGINLSYFFYIFLVQFILFFKSSQLKMQVRQGIESILSPKQQHIYIFTYLLILHIKDSTTYMSVPAYQLAGSNVSCHLLYWGSLSSQFLPISWLAVMFLVSSCIGGACWLSSCL